MFDHQLEERCFQFAKEVRVFCRKLKWDVVNLQDVKQLVRSSASVGANYIEANENVGKGDLKYRLKVCRKEAKESIHFLGLCETFDDVEINKQREHLVDEAPQLRKIFSTMINKQESKPFG
jgi:four helix bundle protein